MTLRKPNRWIFTTALWFSPTLRWKSNCSLSKSAGKEKIFDILRFHQIRKIEDVAFRGWPSGRSLRDTAIWFLNKVFTNLGMCFNNNLKPAIVTNITLEQRLYKMNCKCVFSEKTMRFLSSMCVFHVF